jgi:hypothetical protein
VTRAQRVALWLATVLAAATGGVYAALHYLLASDDPFEKNPLELLAFEGHILTVPLLVFTTGWVFAGHVLARLHDTPARRVSGIALMVLFTVMIASGYLLQVSSQAAVRTGLAWTHGVCGALWTLVFVGHALTGRRLRAEARARRPTTPAGLAAPLTRQIQ